MGKHTILMKYLVNFILNVLPADDQKPSIPITGHFLNDVNWVQLLNEDIEHAVNITNVFYFKIYSCR